MQMPEVLTSIRRDIDKCYFALCFELQSGLPLSIATIEYENVAASIGAAFGQMLDIITGGQECARNKTVRQVLQGFRELVIETERSTFFIMVPENNGVVAIAVGVPSQIKLGYARVAIQKHYPALRDSINEMV